MSSFFSNPSISAFIGAFAAFALVILTDRRRLYRKRSVLRNMISDNGDHARLKLDTVQRNMELVTLGKISDAPIMKFPTRAIEELQYDVADILDANSNQAISAILYWMHAIDEQFLIGATKASHIKAIELRNPQNPEKLHLWREYKDIQEESVKNLQTLSRMIEDYLAGQPEKIVELRHD
jgi:hypothetical protein